MSQKTEKDFDLNQYATSTDQRHLTGPFDIIGDVHGCFSELCTLLRKLGYQVPADVADVGGKNVVAPQGRRAIFVGDLVDRGPGSMPVLRLVMDMVEAGQALSVMGNHDDRFRRWLKGNKVGMTHGLEGTIAEFEHEPATARAKLLNFLNALPLYLWLDKGNLVVAHAGIKEDMLGKPAEGYVRSFCLYGDTEGTRDAAGLPVRYHWAAGYRGKTTVVYGHTPLPKVGWVNNTLCLDTGCCFGGALTALRWPERDIVSVAAETEYTPRLRPLGHPPVRPNRSV